MINFYRRFLPTAASLQTPLHTLTLNSKKKDKRLIQWNDETTQAFEKCKTQLPNAVLLAHPSEDAPLILTCDASNLAIGAVLEQECDG